MHPPAHVSHIMPRRAQKNRGEDVGHPIRTKNLAKAVSRDFFRMSRATRKEGGEEAVYSTEGEMHSSISSANSGTSRRR